MGKSNAVTIGLWQHADRYLKGLEVQGNPVGTRIHSLTAILSKLPRLQLAALATLLEIGVTDDEEAWNIDTTEDLVREIVNLLCQKLQVVEDLTNIAKTLSSYVSTR